MLQLIEKLVLSVCGVKNASPEAEAKLTAGVFALSQNTCGSASIPSRCEAFLRVASSNLAYTPFVSSFPFVFRFQGETCFVWVSHIRITHVQRSLLRFTFPAAFQLQDRLKPHKRGDESSVKKETAEVALYAVCRTAHRKPSPRSACGVYDVREL